jgi:hypothetical protein
MPVEAECPGEAMTLTSSKAAGSNVTDGVKNSNAHFEYSEAGFEKVIWQKRPNLWKMGWSRLLEIFAQNQVLSWKLERGFHFLLLLFA